MFELSCAHTIDTHLGLAWQQFLHHLTAGAAWHPGSSGCIALGIDAAPSSRMPCGACRQVMQELLPGKANVSIDGVGTRQLEQLFPAPFELTQPNIN